MRLHCSSSWILYVCRVCYFTCLATTAGNEPRWLNKSCFDCPPNTTICHWYKQVGGQLYHHGLGPLRHISWCKWWWCRLVLLQCLPFYGYPVHFRGAIWFNLWPLWYSISGPVLPTPVGNTKHVQGETGGDGQESINQKHVKQHRWQYYENS